MRKNGSRSGCSAPRIHTMWFGVPGSINGKTDQHILIQGLDDSRVAWRRRVRSLRWVVNDETHDRANDAQNDGHPLDSPASGADRSSWTAALVLSHFVPKENDCRPLELQ